MEAEASRPQGNRADVMFLINGVPVCIVEHKNPKDGGAIDRGVTQLKRYEKETPLRPRLTASISLVCGQLFSSLFFFNFHRTNFSGFRRTFHQFRSGRLCYFCYSALRVIVRLGT